MGVVGSHGPRGVPGTGPRRAGYVPGVISSCVGAALALLLVLPPTARGQARAAQSEPPPLEFLGFQAGASLSDVAAQVRELGGKRLACRSSRADRRVSECRATMTDPYSGREISLWLSAIDSLSGVLTLSGPMASDQLLSWREDLSRTYGEVDAQVQGPQWMMQWVRRGRMIRLTWRVERGAKVASVSLVDGRVLDDWGRNRRS